MFRKLAVATTAALVLTMLVATPSIASPPPPPGDQDRLAVYTGTVSVGGLAAIVALGVDRQELVTAPNGDASGHVDVQVILSGEQAAQLAEGGTTLEPKAPSAQRRSLDAEGGVFRMYSGEGGILEELMAIAAENPKIAEFRVIGQTVNGKDIGAMQAHEERREDQGRQAPGDGVHRRAARPRVDHARDGPPAARLRARRLRQRPARSRSSSRRPSCGSCPVANPDGYDFTFTDGQRLWRKNLRDNNGDGADHRRRRRRPQPQLPDTLGLRQRGLVARPVERDLPRPAPGLRAGDAGARRAVRERIALRSSSSTTTRPRSCCCYGIGWQVATPTPDDVIYEAMVGDDANPAIPGYDPDISAELYTTNGDTDTHTPGGVRHARLHAGDGDLRDRVGRRTPTTSGSPRTARAASTSPTTRS